MDISQYIDYSLLKPTATEREIINLCNEASKNNFYSVCINSSYVSLANELLEKTDVKICTIVGFPLGAMSTTSKVFEAKKAIENGADEIEVVINLGLLKSRNYVSVLKDISDVKLAIGNTPLKVIIEISELNKNEIIKACEISLDAKVDFIKTSTGFSKGGATLTAVKIIKKTIKDNAKIKAYGGIDDLETALKFIEAGADRVGTSTPIKDLTKHKINKSTQLYKQYLAAQKINEINMEIN
ncbi:deoxyribose-phosphate aldolase [Thalassobellus suaedae]|uniref:Deoxyribose-phosphate aldolase n=1 Tax=Thalassobellus suaedae TaxID=3074124 RepID=A0ABY9Y4C7_9FLAO|nr:deoxyribose-phosphate aldolase [Flavobacteriaceae bacterium HL-DH14]WNH12728.1 deoxyribose-phosphate aldolase [Flavobacteriaceae bacterium HL-DH10]